MDFHALQHKLYKMAPSNAADDLAKLKAAASGGAISDVPPTKDYVNESVEVPEGSMPLDIDNISDFAKLAGVSVNETQKNGDYARGNDPMPKAEPGRTKHPLKDKLVGEDVPGMPPFKAAPPDKALGMTPPGADFGTTAKSVDDYFKNTSGLTAELFKAFYRAIGRLKPDANPEDIKKAAQAAASSMEESISERELTKGEEKKKEKYVKGMKKNKSDFKDRYGDDAEAVMYATATKNAKESTIDSIKDQLYAALNKKIG